MNQFKVVNSFLNSFPECSKIEFDENQFILFNPKSSKI